MICPKCQEEIQDDAKYCPYCGKKQIVTAKPKPLRRPKGSGAVYKLPGRRHRPWVYRYKGERLGYFETEAEAVRFADDFIKHNRPLNYNATLGEIHARWEAEFFAQELKEAEENPAYKRSKTKEDKDVAWLRLSALQNRPMHSIKTSDYQALIASAETIEKETKDGKSRPPKPLSKSGKAKIRMLASQLCQFAMRDDIIDKNYALLFELDDEESTKKDVFTQEQIDRLWAYLKESQQANVEPTTREEKRAEAERMRTVKTVKIILMLIYTGMRIDELLGTKLSNVHLDKHYLIGGLKTKNGIDRVVPIAKKIEAIVTDFYNENTGREYLITTIRGTKIAANNFRSKNFYPTLKKLGIIGEEQRDPQGHLIPRTITPHSTRYTFFNLCRQRLLTKSDQDRLSMIMGHADFEESVDMYGTLTQEDQNWMQSLINSI